MNAVLALLGFLVKTGLDYAKWLAGQLKLIALQVAMKLKTFVLIAGAVGALRIAFFAACLIAFEAAIALFASQVVTPLSSSLLSTILPGNTMAQGIYHILWDRGASLSFAWTLLVTYVANVFLVHRALAILEQTLAWRIMIFSQRSGLLIGAMGAK